ncbi:hypothetical protein M5D96_001619 [Drosophila gunungcola]|uniref:Uncharacterized protein n=1 Tax=Drosophila gunungcola TaxID=103775 RepID=A0A9P9YYF9_9MUSC|nr:hypothetical protein M5D96_001619 [Drosophila gunungcola]
MQVSFKLHFVILCLILITVTQSSLFSILKKCGKRRTLTVQNRCRQLSGIRGALFKLFIHGFNC